MSQPSQRQSQSSTFRITGGGLGDSDETVLFGSLGDGRGYMASLIMGENGSGCGEEEYVDDGRYSSSASMEGGRLDAEYVSSSTLSSKNHCFGQQNRHSK